MKRELKGTPIMGRPGRLCLLAQEMEDALLKEFGPLDWNLGDRPLLGGLEALTSHKFGEKVLAGLDWVTRLLAAQRRRAVFSTCISDAITTQVLEATENLYPQAHRALRELLPHRTNEHWWTPPVIVGAEEGEETLVLTISRKVHSDDGNEKLSQMPFRVFTLWGEFKEEDEVRYTRAIELLAALTYIVQVYTAEKVAWQGYYKAAILS